MAEFQNVAKELERMCNTYHAARKCNTDECPIYREELCYDQTMVSVHGDDACELEKVVMSWAAEHPELVYPTWLEWLSDMGLIVKNGDAYAFHFIMATKYIPADIAQKLGIKPKEGV